MFASALVFFQSCLPSACFVPAPPCSSCTLAPFWPAKRKIFLLKLAPFLWKSLSQIVWSAMADLALVSYLASKPGIISDHIFAWPPLIAFTTVITSLFCDHIFGTYLAILIYLRLSWQLKSWELLHGGWCLCWGRDVEMQDLEDIKRKGCQLMIIADLGSGCVLIEKGIYLAYPKLL